MVIFLSAAWSESIMPMHGRFGRVGAPGGEHAAGGLELTEEELDALDFAASGCWTWSMDAKEWTEAHPGRSGRWQPSRSRSTRLVTASSPFALGPRQNLPAIEAATRDPEIIRRNRSPRPFDARAWFEESSVDQEQGRSVRLLIVDPGTERLLGALSLTPYGDDPASAELGLWTVAEERGRGIGGRAVRLVCDWALGELPLERIVGRTDPDNAASRRVMERLGFELVGPVGDQVAYERRGAAP
jgi:RimJ/RimL family protein N-acetyltransferase